MESLIVREKPNVKISVLVIHRNNQIDTWEEWIHKH
jgi:hypothetical protein